MGARREDGQEGSLGERSGALDVGAIFDAHGAYVARALRCLGVRDQDLPDVCQEVFLVVQRRGAELDGRASMRTWLYAICIRKALAVRRDAARRRAREAPSVDEPPGEGTPQDELERTRKLAQAIAILDGIAEEKRVVFVLYEVEQLAMPEIAQMVGPAGRSRASPSGPRASSRCRAIRSGPSTASTGRTSSRTTASRSPRSAPADHRAATNSRPSSSGYGRSFGSVAVAARSSFAIAAG